MIFATNDVFGVEPLQFAASALSWMVSLVFFHAAWLNLAAPAFIREEFARWGYAQRLRQAVGIAEALGAALLLFESTRLPGLGLLLTVLVGVLVTLIRDADWHRLAFPLLLSSMVLLIALMGA